MLLRGIGISRYRYTESLYINTEVVVTSVLFYFNYMVFVWIFVNLEKAQSGIGLPKRSVDFARLPAKEKHCVIIKLLIS